MPPFLGVGGVGGAVTFLGGWQHRWHRRRLVPRRIGIRQPSQRVVVIDSVTLGPREGELLVGHGGAVDSGAAQRRGTVEDQVATR